MRKYLSWIAAAALSLGFVGCKDRAERNDTTYETTRTTERPIETTRAPDFERAEESAEDRLERIGERLEDDIDRAGDRVERTIERAEDKFEKSADEMRAERGKISLRAFGDNKLGFDADAEVFDTEGKDKLVLTVKNAKPGDYDVILGETCSSPSKAKDINAADEKGVGTATILASQKKLGELKVAADGSGSMETMLPTTDKTIRVQALIVKPEDRMMEEGAMCGMLMRVDGDFAG